MNKIQVWIILLSGLLRLGDTVTDILYFITQAYYNSILYWLCLSFLILPTVIVFGLVTLSQLLQVQFATKLGKFTTFASISMVLGEQFGLASIMYGCYYLLYEGGIEKEKLLFLSKYTAILLTIFESMPQIVIQTYNSGMLQKSSWVLIVSCILCGLDIIVTVGRVGQSFDNSTKIEKSNEMITAIKYLDNSKAIRRFGNLAWPHTEFTIEA